MRANSPRSPGCAEDASNCQPPLQQAALVSISTACKNSAWPSSALVTGRAARWAFAGGDSSAWLLPPEKRCRQSIWLTNFTVPRRGEHSPADLPPAPSLLASLTGAPAGKPAESRNHRSQTLFNRGAGGPRRLALYSDDAGCARRLT